MPTTDSLWSYEYSPGSSYGTFWASCPLSTLESALNNAIPVHGSVTSVKIIAGVSWQCSWGSSSQATISYGFGGTGNLGVTFVNEVSIAGGANHNNISNYPNDTGYEIVNSYLSNKVSPNITIKKDWGSYLTFLFYSNNRFSKTFYVKWVKLSYEYTAGSHNYSGSVTVQPTCTSAGTTKYTCSCGASYEDNTKPVALGHNYVATVVAPTDNSYGYTKHTCSRCGNSYSDSYVYRIIAKSNNDSYGTVTGGGDYDRGAEATITATPKAGCKFVKWSNGSTLASRTFTVTANATYTAEFVLDRINLILADTSQSLGVLIDLAEADKIYADTTKVYG